MVIAVFGGAFDPFHSEHRKIITACKTELNADKVIVVPSYCPPHKSCRITDFSDRVDMVKAGICDLDYVYIDTIELDRNTVNPTSVVLPILKEKYPADRFYFVIGGDSMVHFHTWINPQKVAQNATLAVVAREGYDKLNEAVQNAKKDFGAEIVMLKTTGEEVSSSIIKATVELGLVPQNVPNAVFDIIKARGLYSRYSLIVARLKSSIPERTFKHSVSTTLYAMRFITKLNLNFDKVFLSCILHDCAKHIKTPMEGVPLPVVHQYTGAEIAQNEYGITDGEILGAIRCHTSGKPAMTDLEKLLYVADMTEPNRSFPGVEKLRKTLDRDFEKGFVDCVRACMDNLLEEKNPIYPLTVSCLEYYTKKKGEIPPQTLRRKR